jgi:hypothetical protein
MGFPVLLGGKEKKEQWVTEKGFFFPEAVLNFCVQVGMT